MRARVLLVSISSLVILSAGCGAEDPDAFGKLEAMSPPPLSLTLGADALGAGESLTAEVTLSNPAPTNGAVIMLSSSDIDVLAMPPTITIAGRDDAARFVVTNRYAGKPKSAAIFASYEGVVAEKRLYIPIAPERICNLHACP